MESQEMIITVQTDDVASVFGQFDGNVKKIEKEFGVRIVNREGAIKIVGERRNAEAAASVIEHIKASLEKNEEITEQSLGYIVEAVKEKTADEGEIDALHDDLICLTVNGRPLRPKTVGQKKYVDMIRKDTIVFGIGPAGTGKTYLAMAMAITAFKNNEVNRIILTRPAIEAGEKLSSRRPSAEG